MSNYFTNSTLVRCPKCGHMFDAPEGNDGVHRDGDEILIRCFKCGNETWGSVRVFFEFTSPPVLE